MPFRFNAACCSFTPRYKLTLLPSIQPLQSSSIFLRCNYPQQPSGAHNVRTFVAMAPKQATLGYVKSSPTTLGCGGNIRLYPLSYPAILTVCLQKVLRKTQRRRNKAAIETVLFHKIEACKDRGRDQRGASFIARGSERGAE